MSQEINNNSPQGEVNLGDLLAVRRQKLADLQAEGKDPFVITKFDTTEYKAKLAAEVWGNNAKVEVGTGDGLHEANLLQLNIEKAERELGIKPVYSAETAIKKTTEWYKAFYNGNTDMITYSRQQLHDFIIAARQQNLAWSVDLQSGKMAYNVAV